MRLGGAIVFISAMALFGCTTSPVDLTTAERYVSDEKNGLSRSRTVNGLVTTVRLVPACVNAFREWQGASQSEELGSVIKEHEGQIYFVVNLATDESRSERDIMRHGARNVEQFKEQAYRMNFEWEELVELRCGDERYTPVLSTLENTYGATADRNIILVFAPASFNDTAFRNSEELELVIHDDIKGTGIQHFTFLRKDLERALCPNA